MDAAAAEEKYCEREIFGKRNIGKEN